MQSVIFPNEEKLYEVGFKDGKTKGKSMLENFNESNKEIEEKDLDKTIQIHKRTEILKTRIDKLKKEIDEQNHPRYTEGYIDGLDFVFQDVPGLGISKTK